MDVLATLYALVAWAGSHAGVLAAFGALSVSFAAAVRQGAKTQAFKLALVLVREAMELALEKPEKRKWVVDTLMTYKIFNKFLTKEELTKIVEDAYKVIKGEGSITVQ